MRRWVSAILSASVFALFGAFAAAAQAQDYTVTNTSGQYLTLPASGSGQTTEYTLTDDSQTPAIALPFDFPYYGRIVQRVHIHSNGYLQMQPGSTLTTSSYSNVVFSTTAPSRSGNTDGLCGAWWDDFNPALSTSERIGWYVTGTAPNRILVAFWENVPGYNAATNLSSFQVHLYETTGRIVFAYHPGITTWNSTNSGGSIGFIAGGTDNRFTAAIPTSTQTTKPTVDYRFDPNVTRFTGTASVQAFVADGTGHGNSTAVLPAAGLGVELRNASGVAVATGTVGADGTYTVRGLALSSAQTGSLHLTTSGSACRVSTAGTSATVSTLQVASSLGFGQDTAVAPIVVNDANDASGAFRRPAQILMAVGRAHAWASARTADPIGVLDVLFDNASSEASRWTGASLRIGGAASGNQDAFDVATVMRGYARHLLKAMTGATTNQTTLDLDTRADAVSAAADGLGLYLYAVVDGGTKAYDATSASTANVFDMETPSLATSRGPDVGGWFAAAMYDLVDGRNEAHDLIDGTEPGAAERPFEVLDALTQLSLVDFVLEWSARQYDSASLVKILVHHGVLSDDGDEPDDTMATATALGAAGVRRTGRTLNPFNEDWYRLTVPQDADAFFVDVTYDRSSGATTVLEVVGPSGVLATGSFFDATGPLRATTPAIAGGTEIHVRFAHVAGGHVGTYSLQAYARLDVTSPGPFAWTVGRPLAQPLQVAGGIPPFTLRVKQGTSMPAGFTLDAPNSRVVGTPLDVGDTSYQIVTSDSGDPQNVVTVTFPLTVNAPLAFTAPLLTGVALGKPADVSLGRSGGTPPISVTNFVGDFPEGLELDSAFHITGRTDQPGGGRISFVATDVAGSQANVDTTVVACARLDGGKLAIDLAAGDAAGGIYFDAVAGSTANMALSTARKRAQRDLTVLVVGPDGRAVESGTVKVARGRASLRNVLLPLSGRYFLVLSSADGGPATQLSAALKVTPPRKGGGEALLDFGDTVEFEFGALDGTQLTLSGRTTLGMAVRIAYLVRPDGSVYPAAGILETQAKGRFKFTARLDESGTWTLVLGHRPGPVGEVDFDYGFKHPRGAGYSVD